MKKKKIILLTLIPILSVVAFYVYKEYNRGLKDLTLVKPDAVLMADDLIKQFETNEPEASKKYLGKKVFVAEVKGTIREIIKDERGYYTVVIANANNPSSVRCSMDSMHLTGISSLKTEATAIIKGVITGFNKDELGIGADVILNRCVAIKK